uniref:Uncharacterized protein LOC109505208 n=1 Tax=Elaeis guineensis var. tenera TaxID=51953 RepID=A0A6J0PF27_ELAGV|nr:uncharacterized protein LOC109505208 [Elaeis guineensis]
MDGYLLGLGFDKSLSESTLYVKKSALNIVVVSLYMDDMLVTGSDSAQINAFKQDMMKMFEMTDLGVMSYFLGMEIKQAQNEIFICQKKYLKEILKRFNMEESKVELHMVAAKRVLRYLKGTLSYGIKFYKVQMVRLQWYSDSGWAGSVDDIKSTFGYCFTFGSACFSWCSKKQEIVAQSTAEAEFIAATAAVNQTL